MLERGEFVVDEFRACSRTYILTALSMADAHQVVHDYAISVQVVRVRSAFCIMIVACCFRIEIDYVGNFGPGRVQKFPYLKFCLIPRTI